MVVVDYNKKRTVMFIVYDCHVSLLMALISLEVDPFGFYRSGIGNGYCNFRYIVWQDPLNNGVKLDPATVVQIWLGSGDQLKKYLKEVTSAGNEV